MKQAFTARVFPDGDLILNEKLSATMEGKSFRVILLEESDIERKKQQFLELVAKHSFKLPSDYQFNREEIYER
jgi:hypothetical protein